MVEEEAVANLQNSKTPSLATSKICDFVVFSVCNHTARKPCTIAAF